MVIALSQNGRKFETEIAEKVVYHMAHELMPRIRKLTILIDFQKNLEEKDGMMAYCMDMEDRNFEIGVDRDLLKKHGLREFITAICHEMVHVKQNVRGELMEKDGKQLWKGTDCSDIEYMEQPWEKEAYKLQDELALKIWKDVI